MILLILDGANKYVHPTSSFKFHYDSINSGIDEKAAEIKLLFKFHYDSINSVFNINGINGSFGI